MSLFEAILCGFVGGFCFGVFFQFFFFEGVSDRNSLRFAVFVGGIGGRRLGVAIATQWDAVRSFNSIVCQ